MSVSTVPTHNCTQIEIVLLNFALNVWKQEKFLSLK